MTIRPLPDLLKRTEPLHPAPEARMRQAMGMAPTRPQSRPQTGPGTRPLTPEQDILQSWLRHRCGWT